MRSLWLDEALIGAEDAPPLESDISADVCIVGGGFTGLWTALRLKEREPSLDVVLVEADPKKAIFGPSARPALAAGAVPSRSGSPHLAVSWKIVSKTFAHTGGEMPAP